MAVLGDADGDHVKLPAIDRLENRSGGQKRDFVLAAASTEQNTYAKLPGHVSISPSHGDTQPARIDK
jgi:hypothetical protein